MRNLTLSRAACRVLLFALALAALLGPATAQGPARRPAPAAPPAQGLVFFTIADRLAALRAGGALPVGQAVGAVPAALDGETVPAARDLGLRLHAPDVPVETILGAVAFPVPGGDLAAKWKGMALRWARDEAVIAGCAAGSCRHAGAAKWLRIREEAARRHGIDRIDHVHAALNRSIHYATDFQINGVADYWASPLESVERAGDCEDYVIAKYMMLRSLGTDPADMRLVALFETVSGQYHAILAVRHAGEWLFLDNKRGGLAREADYTAIRVIATVDESGQAMLVAMPPARREPQLRLGML
ncbi:MAG: transglutaminase-like cysteine peptidase [Rhabdaerophilum calidifontis]